MNDMAGISALGATKVFGRAAMGAAAGAVSGSVGSAIMKDAGHDGYQALSGARNGAVGGAIVALPVSLATHILLKPFTHSDHHGRESRPWGLDALIQVASSAAYTATGSAVLRSAGHSSAMDVYHSGRAGLVGSATMLGATVVVIGIISLALSYVAITTFPRRSEEVEMRATQVFMEQA